MAYQITLANGKTSVSKDRPANVPPGGSVKRIPDAKGKAANPVPPAPLAGRPAPTPKED